LDWELPAEKVADALLDPNIMTASTADLGYYLIDLNCQRWPTSDVHFRRALAHMVDKSRIETDILQGFGYKLDSPGSIQIFEPTIIILIMLKQNLHLEVL